jgi:hypothetical protein
MKNSEQINELAAALCKLQGSLHDTTKDKKAYNYNYSDLSQILTYLRPMMAENGLAVTQLVTGTESSHIGVETILVHESGQYISTESSMTVQGQNLAQEAGKVITYLRRYSLSAIVGLTQTDNDAAHKPVESKPVTAKAKPKVNLAALKKSINACESLDALRLIWADNKENMAAVSAEIEAAQARLAA